MGTIDDVPPGRPSFGGEDGPLELFFSQSLDGFFFMMIDEPVQWDYSIDKERVLDYAFDHQRVTKVTDAMLAPSLCDQPKFSNRAR